MPGDNTIVQQVVKVTFQQPRKLGEQETTQTLNHWVSIFTNYYARDSFSAHFLDPDTTWDPEVDDFNVTAEADGRNAQQLKRDVFCKATYKREILSRSARALIK